MIDMPPKESFIQNVVDMVKHPFASVTHYEAPAENPKHAFTRRVREAIAHNETRGVAGDPYAFSRDSGAPSLGRALGRYQVTEGEFKTYGPKYLRQNISADQFLKSKGYQDTYMNMKIAKLTEQGYTPQQIADIHFSGFTNSGPPGSTKYQSPGYVESFNKAFGAPAP